MRLYNPAVRQAPTVGISQDRISWRQEEQRLQSFLGRLKTVAATNPDLYTPTSESGTVFCSIPTYHTASG